MESNCFPLPHEILLKVFIFLDPIKDYLNISLVCQSWKKLFEDQHLWKIFYEKKIGGSLHTHIIDSINYNPYLSNFKWIYECLKIFTIEKKILFSSTFGHGKLFKEILIKENIQSSIFITESYCVQTYKRNIIQGAVDNGFIDIIKAIFSFYFNDEENIFLLSSSFDDIGYNSIHIGAKRGYYKIIEILLQQPKIVTIIDTLTQQAKIPNNEIYYGGISALHLAAENGHHDIVQLLINNNASIDIIDTNTHETPLHFAARSGHKKCIEILLNHGANPCTLSSEGLMAEHLAKNSGYIYLSNFLESCHDSNGNIYKPLYNIEDNWHLYFGGEYEQIARRYLLWMVESHKELVLPGVDGGGDSVPPCIDLESVYLSLKVDRAGSYERLQAFQKLEQKVVEIEEKVDRGFLPEERHAAVVSQLIESPAMPSIIHSNETEDTISLGQAFQSERGLVVLGDPGGGKTTLARWIALQLARSLLYKKERVHVVASQVNVKNVNTRRSETKVDIGITRLPILVRVADFAQYLEKKENINNSLLDYLGYHPWQGSFPSYNGREIWQDDLHDLIVDSLKRGRAVVIIDGLDEVANPQQRQEIVNHVDKFTWQWIYKQKSDEFDSTENLKHLQEIEKATEYLGKPVDTGGNQLVVTSRIAGYHSAPMQSPLTHVTIQPMQENSILSFCNSWMIAVHKIENKGKRDPSSVIQLALNEAGHLHKAICQQAGVRRLAQNPLLLTILALVFRKQKMSLPKRRAQLYHVAMSILVDVWRDCGLCLNDTIQSLAPLAAYLHQNRAMGLISKEDLQQRIYKERKKYYKKKYKGKKIQKNDIKQQVYKFVQVIGDQVGFLVARGESMFGFLHQSFQEYLAGWYLVGGDSASIGINKAAINFINHVGDARWREPLLLSLGMLSEKWDCDDIEDFLHLILQSDNNVSGSLMPRAALLIVSALHEMLSIPNSVKEKLQVLLLLSYSNQNKYNQNSFELLRYRIEEAFKDLVILNEDQVLSFFTRALTKTKRIISIIDNNKNYNKNNKKNGNYNNNNNIIITNDIIENFCGACGEIIYKLNIFSKELCSSLQYATKYDSKKWGWIIHRCLRRYISAKYPKKFDKSFIPSESWIKLSFWKKIQNIDDITIYHKFLLSSLCGGFKDYNVVESTQEYFGYVNLLLMVDEARQAIYEQNRSFERWGDQGNVSYNIALYLDSFIPQLFWKIDPDFSIYSFHRWSPLMDILSNYLCDCSNFNLLRIQEIFFYIVKKLAVPTQFKTKITSAISSLRSKLSNNTTIPIDNNILSNIQAYNDIKILKTDALIGLIGTGFDIKKLMRDDCITLCDLDKLDVVIHSVRDAAARSRFSLYPCLRTLAKTDTARFYHILIASLTTITRAANILDITSSLGVESCTPGIGGTREILKLCDDVGCGEQRSLIFACYMLDRISSLNNEDREYHAALCADNLLQNCDYIEFAKAFAMIPVLYRIISQNIPFADPWPAGQTLCSPVWDYTEILPIESLSAIETVPLTWWKPHAIEYFTVSAARSHPYLLPELLAVQLYRVESETGKDPFGGLAPLSFRNIDPQEALKQAIYEIDDKYYRARALWRLCRYIPQDECFTILLNDALETAQCINDPHRKVVVLEKIIEMLPKPKALRIFSNLIDLTYLILDHENRARTFARLSMSPLASREQSSNLLKLAIKSSSYIIDCNQRATVLSELHMIIIKKKRKKELSLWQKTVDKLNDKWCIAFAEGNYGRILFECVQYLSTKQCEETWMALTLYGLFEDAKAIADLPSLNWNSRLWSAILEDVWHNRAYEALRKQAIDSSSYGLALDQSAAQAIDCLLQKAKLLQTQSLQNNTIINNINNNNNNIEIDKILELYEHIYELLSLVGEVSTDALVYLPNLKQLKDELPVIQNNNYKNIEIKIIQQLALLEAEQGILTLDNLPYIFELIQNGDDRSRLRAQVALHGESFNTGNSYRRLRTSILGIDVLLLLAKTSWDGIQQKRLMLSQTIRWMGHDMIHDDPNIVNTLVELYDKAETEEDLFIYSLWLGICECITENAWQSWLKLLPKGAASKKVQSILLVGVCKTAHSASHCEGNMPINAFQDLIKCNLDPEVTKNLTCCEEWPTSIANAAQLALRKLTNDSDPVILANNEFELERSKKSLYISLDSLNSLSQFGRTFFHHYNANNRVESCVPTAILQLIKTPQILSSIILPWLVYSLEEKTKNNKKLYEYDVSAYRKTDSLLQVASGLAKRLPVTFQNCSTPKLASLLANATTDSISAFGRIAAMELLSIYGHVSEKTIIAMKCALLDVSFVAESALLCTKQFRYLDDGLLDFLIKELYHEYPSMSLATARILSAVYLEPCTSAQQRNIILEALADALKHPNIKNKPVFTMINTAKKITANHASETMICCIGDLDQAIFHELSFVCGFSTNDK